MSSYSRNRKNTVGQMFRVTQTFFSLFWLFLLPAEDGGVASGEIGRVAEDTRLMSSRGESSCTDLVFPLGPALISIGGAVAGFSPI